MKRYYFTVYLFLSVFLLSNCGNKKTDIVIPSNLISKEKMTLILEDIHLIEALITNVRIGNADSSRVAFANLQKEVFRKHKVDSLKYAQSYQFYVQNTALFKEIYQVVCNNLQKKDSLARAKKEPTPKAQIVQDSSKQNKRLKDVNIQRDIDAFKQKNKTTKDFKNKILKKQSNSTQDKD